MRLIVGVWLGLLAVGALGAQTGDPPARILAVASRSVVSFDALVADIARADVVLVNERASTPAIHRFELAMFQALAGRRSVVVAFDAVDSAAQDPLEHFQMEHLSDEEFLAQATISPDAAAAYLPLMKLAVARRWPIVATGPRRESQDSIARTLVQALDMGSIGGTRGLLVSLHAGAENTVMATAADLVVAQSPGRRVVVVQLVAAPSPRQTKPPAEPAAAGGYVVYAF